MWPVELLALPGEASARLEFEADGNIEGRSMIRRCEDEPEVLEDIFDDHESFKRIRRRQRALMPVSGSLSSIRGAHRSRLSKGTKRGFGMNRKDSH